MADTEQPAGEGATASVEAATASPPAAAAPPSDTASPQASTDPAPPAPDTETAAPAPERPKWQGVPEDVDPAEVLKDRRVAGLFGNRLQKEREGLKSEFETWKAQYLEEQKNARLLALAEKDDDESIIALAEEKKREVKTWNEQRQTKTAAQQDEERTQALRNEVWQQADAVMLMLMDDLTQESGDAIRQKFLSGGYGTDPIEARKTFHREVRAAAARAEAATELQKARAEWEREKAALRQELLGEAASGEPRLDKDSGAPPGGQVLTLERYQAMSYDERMSLKRKSPELIDAMTRGLQRVTA